MNISFSISNTPSQTPPIDNQPPLQQTNGSNKTLTVSITPGTLGSQGGSPPTAITLSYPLIGPEDISLNEIQQQLKNLNFEALSGMTLTAAVLMLNDQVSELAAGIIKGGKDYLEKNAAEITKAFGQIEEQLKQTETQLFDLINNSSYPDYSEFLGKMLIAAQELRQLASTAKHHMVMAEYDNVLDQAKQMQVAAQKNYESTMKEIQAARTEAIGKIISGALSIASTAVGGGLGMKFGAGGVMGAQLGSGIGQALAQIATGGAELASAKMKEDAAALKLEADLAGVIQKKYEATQKLLQEAQSITEELANIGKTLTDMILKLYQDFLSNQAQIVQRSNI